jgi:transcriptional regulator with PAS, ATPase and Fis domain
MPVAFENGEIFASVALIKFSGYTNKLVQSLQEMGAEIEYYRKELIRHSIAQYSFASLPTSSEAYREAKHLAERFANSDLPILLQGETGVGKEVFANAIHNASSRRDGPFICINCASIPAELLESELFGYEEGAFSGSRRGGKRGKFELADHGTLLLDEIGDMPPPLQVKLLRVLQNNIIEKVGGERPTQVDVRILAATNHNLEKKIESGAFREDLYYRLNVLPVIVPALRDRKEDIPALVYTFLDELNQKYSRRLSISPETLACLQRYCWPGNIRELKNVVGRSFMTTDGKQIQPSNLPPYLLLALDRNNGSEALNALLLQQERDIILSTLRKHRCNCAKAARTLGIHRATLYTKMEKYGICIHELRKIQEAEAARKETAARHPSP